ncbi:hypothetical protein PRECH8_26090 [Insulibacter thermoxylanivorax]|uniref:Uncharacterized protein n=1 Tax=Insulibacter thermoxylanivorax TaxID=2749268 RepID=A0A916QH11_9BACL|nr:hypothetical protein PRECH8_26090 [Insulibacter thermoxylanivorax]
MRETTETVDSMRTQAEWRVRQQKVLTQRVMKRNRHIRQQKLLTQTLRGRKCS